MREEKDYHDVNKKDIIEKIVNDPFVKFLNMEVEEVGLEKVVTKITTKEYMSNAYDTVHGGLIYSLADYTFSILCNIHGRVSLGINTNMQFLSSGNVGETLYAEAIEINKNYKIGFYQVKVTDEDHNTIALMNATSYRKSQKVL